MCKVKIIDAICGKGKTSWAIQYMNENVEKKFIYITPYIDEVERVVENCSDRFFYQPNVKNGEGSKLKHFNKLLSEGKNIVSTHALFSLVNEDTLKFLKENEYSLILDEVFNVIEEVNIKKSDRQMLLDTKKIEILEDGKVVWLDKEYDGNLNEYRKKIENGDVYLLDGALLLWTFPIRIFDSIKETYILTYMFSGQMQRYYYDMYKISYQYYSVERKESRYELIEYRKKEDLEYLKELITICDNEKLNSIGKKKGKGNPLSKTWYDNQNKKKLDGFDILKKNMVNFFQNICKSKSIDNAWTTFKDYRYKCQGNGYSKGFIPCNARATNIYRNKKNLAYCVNIFNNPKLLKFFTNKGVIIDEESYALSEMIQWIFRSQLRDLKPINLYIPSERMRNLFINWLN